MMFRASIETASAISGVSIEELNWLKSTRPIFTVLAGDQAIPYFEFGPGIQEELSNSSGLTVRALEDAVELIDWAGQVSRFELPAADASLGWQTAASAAGNVTAIGAADLHGPASPAYQPCQGTVAGSIGRETQNGFRSFIQSKACTARLVPSGR